jgi:hypothetical protein
MKNTILYMSLLCFATGVLSAQTPTPDRIVGSWVVHVPGPDGTSFNSVHTYGADGTFSETTDLLSLLGEGPGHGVWEFRGGKFLLTFELFAFDPKTKEPAGRIRVRAAISMDGNDKIKGETIVDLIEPDGNVIEGIADGPFTGVRMKVITLPGLKPADAPQSAEASRALPSAIERRLGLPKTQGTVLRPAR